MEPESVDLLQCQRAVFRSDLRSTEKLVALALLDHWSRAGETFPSINRLAEWATLDRTTVMRALGALKERGAVVVIQGERGKANRYELGHLSRLGAGVAHRSHHATSRTTRPVAPADLNRSHQATGVVAPRDPKEPIEGTQGRNPLERVASQGCSPTKGATERKRKPRQSAPELALPPDWQPTDAHRAYAAKHGLDVELEVDSLRGWAEGRAAVSWNGTFTTRLANQVKWNRQRGANSRRGPVVQRGVRDEAEAANWGKAGAEALLRNTA